MTKRPGGELPEPDNKKAKTNEYLLHDAIRAGNLEEVKKLISNGANLLESNESRMTPLLVSVNHSKWDICLELLKHDQCQEQLSNKILLGNSIKENILGHQIALLAIEDKNLKSENNNKILDSLFEVCKEFLDLEDVSFYTLRLGSKRNPMFHAIKHNNEQAVIALMPHYKELFDDQQSKHDRNSIINEVLNHFILYDTENIDLALFLKHLPDQDYTAAASFDEESLYTAAYNLIHEDNSKVLELLLDKNMLCEDCVRIILCYELILEKKDSFNKILKIFQSKNEENPIESTQMIRELLSIKDFIEDDEALGNFIEQIEKKGIDQIVLNFLKSLIDSEVKNNGHDEILYELLSQHNDKYDPSELCKEILSINEFSVNEDRIASDGSYYSDSPKIVPFSGLERTQIEKFINFLKDQLAIYNIDKQNQDTFLKEVRVCWEEMRMSSAPIKEFSEEKEPGGVSAQEVDAFMSENSSNKVDDVPPAGENPESPEHLDG